MITASSFAGYCFANDFLYQVVLPRDCRRSDEQAQDQRCKRCDADQHQDRARGARTDQPEAGRLAVRLIAQVIENLENLLRKNSRKKPISGKKNALINNILITRSAKDWTAEWGDKRSECMRHRNTLYQKNTYIRSNHLR